MSTALIGSTIEPNDPFWSDVTALAAKAKDTPEAWLSMRHIYGDLGDDPRFTDSFTHWLSMIYDTGLEATLGTYLA